MDDDPAVIDAVVSVHLGQAEARKGMSGLAGIAVAAAVVVVGVGLKQQRHLVVPHTPEEIR